MFDARADSLETVVAPTFHKVLKERYDAVWQNPHVNPRMCPSEGASLCTDNACMHPYGLPGNSQL